MSAFAFGVTEIDSSSALVVSLALSELAARRATSGEEITSMLVCVVRCGSCWPFENRLFPNSVCANPGSRKSSSEEELYCFAERAESTTAMTTHATTVVTTTPLRRHSTESSSNGDTVGAAEPSISSSSGTRVSRGSGWTARKA